VVADLEPTDRAPFDPFDGDAEVIETHLCHRPPSIGAWAAADTSGLDSQARAAPRSLAPPTAALPASAATASNRPTPGGKVRIRLAGLQRKPDPTSRISY